jgi:hypothetical protein
MNGFHVLVLAFIFVAGPILIKKALRYDRWVFEMDNLDDEELAAAMAEFPDLFERRPR